MTAKHFDRVCEAHAAWVNRWMLIARCLHWSVLTLMAALVALVITAVMREWDPGLWPAALMASGTVGNSAHVWVVLRLGRGWRAWEEWASTSREPPEEWPEHLR